MRLAVVSCLCCLGNTHLQPPNRLPDLGPINGFPAQRRCGQRRIDWLANRHLLSLSCGGSTSSLARYDQTDVGLSGALPLALAFSVLPRLRPLTRLAVRSARSRFRAGSQRFHVPQPPQDDLGPPSTPAAGYSRRATVKDPDWLRAFWPKPISLFGLTGFTMLTGVHLVLTMSSDSSALPD